MRKFQEGERVKVISNMTTPNFKPMDKMIGRKYKIRGIIGDKSVWIGRENDGFLFLNEDIKKLEEE